jgi:O-antigen ligase
VNGIYLGFFLSSILLAPSLPVVGTKFAAPDIPLLLALTTIPVALTTCSNRAASLGHREKNILWLGFAFLYWASLSLAYNDLFDRVDILNSVIELANYSYGFGILVGMVLLVNDWDKWNRCVIAWLLGVALVSTLSILAALGLAPEWAHHGAGGNRIASTFRTVNQLHGYVAPTVPMLALIALRKNLRPFSRPLACTLLVGALIALLLTGSRMAIFLAGISCVFVVVSAMSMLRRHPWIFFTIVVSVFSLAAAGAFVVDLVLTHGAEVLPPGMKAIGRIVNGLFGAQDFDELAGPRGEQMGIVYENWWRQLVLGVGPGNFSFAYNHRHEIHNSFLGVFVEQGLPGLLLLISFVGITLYYGYRFSVGPSGQARLMQSAVIAFFVINVYGLFSFGIRQRIFWLAAGLVVCGIRISSRERTLQRATTSRSIFPAAKDVAAVRKT